MEQNKQKCEHIAERAALSHSSLDIQMTYAKPAPGGGGPRGAAPPTAPASSSEARSRNSSWSLPREAARSLGRPLPR